MLEQLTRPAQDDAERVGREQGLANTTWRRYCVAWVDRATGEVCAAAWAPWPCHASMYYAVPLDDGAALFGRFTRRGLDAFDARAYLTSGSGVTDAAELDDVSLQPLGYELYARHRHRVDVDAYLARCRLVGVDAYARARTAAAQPAVGDDGTAGPAAVGRREPTPNLFTPKTLRHGI